MFALLAALMACSTSFAQQVKPSPALAQLQQEAQKDPAASATAEGAKNGASQGFSGDGQGVSAPLPTGKDANGQAYVMLGQQPVKGINIYTPRLDPTGRATTDKPKAADLIGKKKVMGAAALGAGAIAAGFMMGGTLGGILIAAGGAFLGIAAVLGFLRHKLNKSKAA